MARYSRRLGPPSPFALSATLQDVTGMSVTRLYDAGELLITYRANVFNGPGSALAFKVTVTIDDQPIPVSPMEATIGARVGHALAEAIIIPVKAGTHKISMQCAGDGIAGDTLNTNSCQICVIQLPLWDSDADIS